MNELVSELRVQDEVRPDPAAVLQGVFRGERETTPGGCWAFLLEADQAVLDPSDEDRLELKGQGRQQPPHAS